MKGQSLEPFKESTQKTLILVKFYCSVFVLMNTSVPTVHRSTDMQQFLNMMDTNFAN